MRQRKIIVTEDNVGTVRLIVSAASGMVFLNGILINRNRDLDLIEAHDVVVVVEEECIIDLLASLDRAGKAVDGLADVHPRSD